RGGVVVGRPRGPAGARRGAALGGAAAAGDPRRLARRGRRPARGGAPGAGAPDHRPVRPRRSRMEQRVRPQKLRVIDVHTHFPIENTMGGPPPGPRHPLLEAYARERGERMRAEWGTAPAEPLARTDQEVDAALERWVGEVERYDLDKVVFVCGGGNDRLAGLVAKHPDRFVGLAHHRLEPGAGAELRRAVDELGLRGYKLLGPTTDYPFEAPELRDVWEFLAERQLPALIHFGFLGRGGGVVQHPRMSPLSLFEVARDFPEVPFIVPHFGAGYFQ